MNVAAIILAAGRGERAGARVDKVLQPLGGRPVIAWSAAAFRGAAGVSRLVLVTPPGREDEFLARAFPDGVPVRPAVSAVAGGSRRQDSVRAGLAAVDAAIDLVAVHDGARPFVDGGLIARLIESAARSGAAVPVVPVSDTIVETAADGRLRGYLDRGGLRAVQTPQVFRRDWLVAAHAPGEAPEVTDDAALVARLGHPVTLVPGEATNFKLTTEYDFLCAGALAARMRRD